jgi:hypothetical protein
MKTFLVLASLTLGTAAALHTVDLMNRATAVVVEASEQFTHR